jgi:hypothetical protein
VTGRAAAVIGLIVAVDSLACWEKMVEAFDGLAMAWPFNFLEDLWSS